MWRRKNFHRVARCVSTERVWLKAAEITVGPYFCACKAAPLTATGSESAKHAPSPGADTSSHLTSLRVDICCKSRRKSHAPGRKDVTGIACPNVSSASLEASARLRKTSAVRTTARCAPDECPTIRTSSTSDSSASQIRSQNLSTRHKRTPGIAPPSCAQKAKSCSR